jgi:hypothetical protein
MSFSSGAFSTSAFSTNAFDFGDATSAATSAVAPSGGFPSDRGPTKEQKRRSRVLFGIEKDVITEVARRQAESLDLDELQQKEELLAELKLRSIEARSLHFEELAKQREALISAEIAKRLQLLLEEEELMMLMAVATCV